MIPAGHWLPRRFAACQRDRRHPAVSLTQPASGEPSPTGANHIVLTGRVPQAAVTSGIQRSVTVTPRGPLSGPSAPDQGKRSGPKLHGMQGGQWFDLALLRCVDQGYSEGASSVLNQIAVASSSNATATRWFAGASTANS